MFIDDFISRTRNVIIRVLLGDHCFCGEGTFSDEVSEMTGGRLLARFLARWLPGYYTPNKRADLDQAWSYYEHYTLARIYADDQKQQFLRAPAGESNRPTVLYPLFGTPLKELGDWGFSIRMYFSTLMVLAAALGVAGFLNIPLSIYFSRTSYSSNDAMIENGEPWMIKSSALCLNQENVEGVGNRNVCNFDDWLTPGLFSYAASMLLLVQLGFAFFWLQRKAEIVFDEDMQTASDYAVKVTNPPADALDPQEWKDFFDQFAADPEDGVTFCAVAIDNAALLQKLVERRKLLRQIARKLPGINLLDQEAVGTALLTEKKPGLFSTSAQAVWNKLMALESDIHALANRKYKAVSVFCIFETERAQRNALHCLSTGRLQAWRNQTDLSKFQASGQLTVQENAESSRPLENASVMRDLFASEAKQVHSIKLLESTDEHEKLDTLLRFRGERVLKVKEACEPNDVRWADLQVPGYVRTLQYTVSTIALMCFMAWSGFFIHWLEINEPGRFYTPLFITITNLVVPKICELINEIESHSTEASRQASLYVKVALFRWFNSAIALTLVIGFVDTISFEGATSLNTSVYNLICAEMFSGSIIKLCDFMGIYRKHFLAPRAFDQEEMNACFVGTKCELSERYTDATKVLFVALFYSAILPQSLFLGAAALVVHGIVAKFMLLRMWRTAPDVGATLSRLSRNVFFSGSAVMHVVMSAYWWSGYPFDNICEAADGTVGQCDQDMMRRGLFPPLPRYQTDAVWMTESQATITSLYGWTALVVVVIASLLFVKTILIPFVMSFFRGSYEPDGKDQDINFSKAKTRQEVEAYIPNLRDTGFSYPFLACYCDDLDIDLFDWRDENDHVYSLAHDVRDVMGGADPEHIVMSPIEYWPVQLVHDESD